MAEKNSLITVAPNLVKEWDYEKNNPLLPSHVTAGSDKKVWWICEKGHEWQSIIYNRIKGSGCPYCAGKLPIRGINDLATLYPDLLKEWNYDKNLPLIPENVTVNSEKSVWWICKKGHEWKSIVSARTKGSGCPYCAGKVAISGINDLATVNPELAKEWNYEKNSGLTNGLGQDISAPKNVMANSKSIVWWICEFGHEWRAAIYSRNSGNGCPNCTHASTSKPEQAIAYYLEKCCQIEQRFKINNMEIDIYLPEYKIGIEYDGKYYHQDKEKDKKKTRALEKEGINIFRVIEGDENIVDGNNIYYVYDNMEKNYEWSLSTLFKQVALYTNNNHIASIHVDIKNDAIDIRERYSLVKKKNSIASKFPNIAKEWNYKRNGRLNPDMVSYGAHDRVWWICNKGHEWIASVSNRSKGYNCPYCNGQRAIPGVNDLVTVNPKLAQEWNYEKNKGLINGLGRDISVPQNVMANTNNKVWWICEKGHEWEATIDSRNKGNGCPYCSKRHRLLIQCVETNEVFKNLREASESIGVSQASISNCCNGKCKTVKGYHWRYINV